MMDESTTPTNDMRAPEAACALLHVPAAVAGWLSHQPSTSPKLVSTFCPRTTGTPSPSASWNSPSMLSCGR